MNESNEYSVDYLRNKLNTLQSGVREKYGWYEMTANAPEYSIVTPPELKIYYNATLGWCEKAVESLADRLVFREFKGDQYGINDIFKYNNADIFFDSAVQSALISSCCFVYISKLKDSNTPRLEIIEGYKATGVIDPSTGLLKYGYAVLKEDQNKQAEIEAYFTPNETIYYYKENRDPERIEHDAGQCLLVPIIYKPDAKRPFGRSRITKSCIYHQRYAKRTLERADVTAEFYSFPQKYILGTDKDLEIDTWKATISTLLDISKDEKGGKPSVGQFTTPSMEPFIDQLRMSASLFAGETGLTLDDLGFVSDNPSSVEAIMASHETLRLMARKAQRNFGVNFKNVGYVAKCLQDEFAYGRDEFVKLEAKWEPIFEPNASTMSTMGDAAIKTNKAIPGFFDKDSFRDLTGIEGAE